MVGSATLNIITDPKNMFITDIRKRRVRPDISVPEKNEGSSMYGLITQVDCLMARRCMLYKVLSVFVLYDKWLRKEVYSVTTLINCLYLQGTDSSCVWHRQR